MSSSSEPLPTKPKIYQESELYVLIPIEPMELPVYAMANDLLMIAPAQKEETKLEIATNPIDRQMVVGQVSQVVYQDHLEIKWDNSGWEFPDMPEDIFGPPSLQPYDGFAQEIVNSPAMQKDNSNEQK